MSDKTFIQKYMHAKVPRGSMGNANRELDNSNVAYIITREKSNFRTFFHHLSEKLFFKRTRKSSLANITPSAGTVKKMFSSCIPMA